jgi:hypothetical protein
MSEPEKPTLTEAAAVFAAVSAYADQMDGGIALAADLPRLMERLAGSIRRVQAVTR